MAPSLLLDAKHREILTDLSQWRIVSSLFPPDVPPIGRHVDAARMKASSHHSHVNDREILMVLRGESTWIQGGKVYPFCPGMIYLNDVFEPHDDCSWLYANTCDVLIARVRPGAVAMGIRSAKDGTQRWLTGSGLYLDAARHGVRLDECWSELKVRKDLPSRAARALMLSAIATAFARVLDPLALADTRWASPPRRPLAELLEGVCLQIRRQGGRKVSAWQVAELCGYSESRFRHLFRQHVGVSFHRYVDDCRAERVRELLNLGVTRKQVAMELGFPHTSALSRWERTRNGQKSVQDEA